MSNAELIIPAILEEHS